MNRVLGSTSSILHKMNRWKSPTPLTLTLPTFEHHSMRKKCPVLPSKMSILWSSWTFPSQRKETIAPTTLRFRWGLSSPRKPLSPPAWNPSPFSMSLSTVDCVTFTPSCVHALSSRFSTATPNFTLRPFVRSTVRVNRSKVNFTNLLETKSWLSSWNWKRPSSISRPHLRQTSAWLRNWPAQPAISRNT